jgi:23S rRNA pseudouridine2605 synthase
VALDSKHINWRVTMHEGRNRQIRRTFDALGYGIRRLHRLQIGNYNLGDLEESSFKEI